jgi:hypothetical protein
MTVHLISGLPCSGKTTYSQRLQAQERCALFSLDRWLITTFDRYSISEIGHPEHVRRVLAMRALIWEASAELLSRGVDVILDDGFFFREHRMKVAAAAAELGARATIHHLDVPLDDLRARLVHRNAHLPQFNFVIDPALLESFLAMYERPSDDEGATVIRFRDADAAPAVAAAHARVPDEPSDY